LKSLIVLFVVMVVAAIAVPNVLLAVSNIRLRASAGDLAGTHAAGENHGREAQSSIPPLRHPYVVLWETIAYIDLNGDGSWSSSVTAMSSRLLHESGQIPRRGAHVFGNG